MLAEAQVAKGYMAVVRALLLEDGEPPLEQPGMLIYERAQAIQESFERCLTKKEPHLLQRMVSTFSKLGDQASRYEAVARWAKPIAQIAATLEPDEDKTSETVEWEMT